jgi:hypothetical protein
VNCGTIPLADQHYYLHYLILSGKYLSIARRISLYDQSFSILMSMKGNCNVKTECRVSFTLFIYLFLYLILSMSLAGLSVFAPSPSGLNFKIDRRYSIIVLKLPSGGMMTPLFYLMIMPSYEYNKQEVNHPWIVKHVLHGFL